MTVFLDAETLDSPERLHAEIARQMALPDWYGRNLDALFDVLGSQSEPVTFEIRGLAAMARLGEFWPRFLRMLADAEREGTEIRISLSPRDLIRQEDEQP